MPSANNKDDNLILPRETRDIQSPDWIITRLLDESHSAEVPFGRKSSDNIGRCAWAGGIRPSLTRGAL